MATHRSPEDVFHRRPDIRRSLGPLRVEMWRTGREASGFHRQIFSYRMFDLGWDPETPIFQDHGFMPAAYSGIQSKVLDLLEWLTLAEGDADEDYFKDYTPRQLKWRDERADDLHMMVKNLEMDIADAREASEPMPDIFYKKQDWSPRDDK